MKPRILEIIYKFTVRQIFFLINPEIIHELTLKLGHFLGTNRLTQSLTKSFFYYKNPVLKQNICGLEFENPVGLSAGFDKDADLLNILPSVGFGFMSIGSITDKSYEGNKRPWLVRLKKSKSILVNYGLKNRGVEYFINRYNSQYKMQRAKIKFPLFISIAKTNCKETADTQRGIQDYVDCTKKLVQADVGDVYELNISCPNAYGGEPFTTVEKLDALLLQITTSSIQKPIFIKMPINLPWNEFKTLLDVCLKYQINGVIIGNLNKDRKDSNVKDRIPENISGNLSGKPTEQLSNYLISETYKYCGKKLIIIGVGGIFNAQDAYEKIKRGANLVALITGMIFEGPQLIGQINMGLVELLKKDGFSHISQAIGVYYN